MNEFTTDTETETIPYVSCTWPTDPVLYELNAKLDEILALLDEDD